jgi:hypothetical protein
LRETAYSNSRVANLFLFSGLLTAVCAGIGTAWGYYHTKGMLGIDWLTIFYPAALHWRQGQPVYSFDRGYYYAPPVLILTRLFSLFGRLGSLDLWIAASVAMIIGSTLLTASVFGWRPRWTVWLPLLIYLMCSVPVVMLIVVLGQSSAWVLFGMACGMWLSFRGYDRAAGAAFAITLVKPQIAFLVLPLLVYKRQWRSVAAYVVVAMLATIGSFIAVGPSMFSDYLHLQQLLYDGTFSNDGMQVDVPGIHGLLLQEWPHSAAANRMAELIDIALIAALAWKWRGPRQVEGRSFSARWALLVVVTVFVSPFAHIYDTAILALPAVVLVAAYSAPEITPWDRRAIIVTLAALDSGPFLRLLFSQHFQTPGLVLAILMLWRLDSLFSVAAVSEPAEKKLGATARPVGQIQGKTASA